MWQAIAEVVKQGMKNFANVGKNAQTNGSVANGGVGLVNTDSKKTDSQSQNKDNESTSQVTENTSSVETAKQDAPADNNVESSSGGGGGMPNMPMGDKGSPMGDSGSMGDSGADMASSMGSVTSDENAKVSKDVSNDTKNEADEKSKTSKENTSKLKSIQNYAKGISDGAKNAQYNGSVATPTPITPTVVSDERLKDIFGEETPIDCFAKIHAYEFTYTPEAQEMLQGRNHVDDKEHLGVMAQELLSNPATSACVIKDTDGFLKVDTAQLTMANTATIAELSRKIQKLEEMLGER